ncbi:MAG: response regulator [Planctomycetes bacterium]|nr:response regulator [Planctomycetota bacterium]
MTTPTPERVRQTNTPTVLIADRNAALLEAVSGHLRTRGVAVETAASGVECLRKLRSWDGGIAVLDLDLPWGGGDGVLAVLREEPDLAPFGAVLATSNDSPHPERLTRPVVGLLERPYTPEALFDAVCRALDGETRQRVRAPACER